MSRVSAIDLFCGAGGMTHGLIRAGVNVVAGIDNDESSRYAFEKNNECHFIGADVREVTARQIEELYPSHDVKVLVGCAPCQPFSRHTVKYGEDKQDKRRQLLDYFSHLVSAIKPEVVSMENVMQISRQPVFTDFVATLLNLGYYVHWDNVSFVDYGVPQRRKRLILLASLAGEIGLIPKTHDPRNYVTVRDTIGDLEPIEAGGVSTSDPLHRSVTLSPINLKRIRQSRPGGTWLDWNPNLLCECHRRPSGRTYKSIYGRMKWDSPAPTLTTQFYSYGTGRYGHPKQDRAISLREGALLQTFPKYYEFIDPEKPMSLHRIATHIGNAVPVHLGFVIGESIMRHIEAVNCG